MARRADIRYKGQITAIEVPVLIDLGGH